MPPSAKASLRSLLALSLLALVGACLLSASAARAATYTVHPCDGHPISDFDLKNLAGIEFAEVHATRFDAGGNCGLPGGTTLELVGHNTVEHTNINDRADWTFRAPGGTEIREISFDQEFSGGGWDPGGEEPTNLTWRVSVSGSAAGALEEAGNKAEGLGRLAPPSDGRRNYKVGTEIRPGEFPRDP